MVMIHTCHAYGCNSACPPKHLMCPDHWAQVPPDLQAEVYATVGKRKKGEVDHTWAPWWRAQARAVGIVRLNEGHGGAAYDRWMAHEMSFADGLEADVPTGP